MRWTDEGSYKSRDRRRHCAIYRILTPHNHSASTARLSRAGCGVNGSDWHLADIEQLQTNVRLISPRFSKRRASSRGLWRKVMQLQRRKFLHLVAGAVALPTAPRIARAQVYPSR